MSKKESKKVEELTIEYIKKLVGKAAKANLTHPSNVNLAMLKVQDERITDWSLRTFGGISGIKKYFPINEKDLAEIKKQKDLKSYISKLENDLGNKLLFQDRLLSAIRGSIERLELPKYEVPKLPPVDKRLKQMTVELMLSDIHFGKKSDTFDLTVVKERLRKLTAVFLKEIEFKKQQGYNVERLILALLGDIIESFSMHNQESALSCEFNNPNQIYVAIKVLFDEVFLPIGMTGLPIHVPAVAGNHDRTEQNRTYNNPGENYMSWVIYNCLKDYCAIAGLKNIVFDIPIDSFTTTKIYGRNVLYEHLDNAKSTQKNALDDLIFSRGRQLGIQIDMLRGGHWHEYVCYDRGRSIINESVCGQDSYARVKGFASSAGQTINFYVNDPKLPNAFLYSYPVHLA